MCNIYYAVALPYGKTESDACHNIQEKKHKEKRAIWELKDLCNLRKKKLGMKFGFILSKHFHNCNSAQTASVK